MAATLDYNLFIIIIITIYLFHKRYLGVFKSTDANLVPLYECLEDTTLFNTSKTHV